MSILPAGAVALAILAQAPAGADPALASRDYLMGPGDVLEVAVAGRPDLSRLPTVQTTGDIWLPRAGEVAVAGLSCAEVARRIEPLLVAEDLPAPRVSVSVKEYQSQFVWVRGAVTRPGRKPLRSGMRLVDALLDAGGFAVNASGEVAVERSQTAFPDGGHALSFRFRGREPGQEELENLALPLRGGDVITASTQYWVAIGGSVTRPGTYELEPGMTLGRLIEKSGGVTRFGSDVVTVRRRGAAGGDVQTLEVDLKAVRAGEAPDPALQPNDDVAVRARRF